jgi:hypothetical protein
LLHRKLSRAGVALAVAAVTIALTAGPAVAHEQRQVGAHQLTVGWQHEPTYTGVLNAVQIFIKDAKGNPVDDLGDPPTLQVTVSTGNQTSSPLELEASFDPDTGLGTHGEFDASIIPTAPGTYTFHFTGTVQGQKIDEKFTSSDQTFDNVVDPTAVEFPTKLPNTADLATSVTKLTPRVDNAVSTSSSAHDKATTATTLAIIALVVAVVLGAIAIVIASRGRRRQAT